MKTLILTVALVSLAAFTRAQETGSREKSAVVTSDPQIEVALLQHNENEVTLMMEKEHGKAVKIKVYEGNMLLYSKRIKKEATVRITYDISAFPDGNYTFKVVAEKEPVYVAEISKGAGSGTIKKVESLADNK